MHKKHLDKSTLKQYISKNRLEEVVNSLQYQVNEFLDKASSDGDQPLVKKLSNAIIINSGKLRGMEQDKAIGLLDWEAQNVITSEVQQALLFIIDDLPENFWRFNPTDHKDLSYHSKLLEGVEILHETSSEYSYDIFICFSTRDRAIARPVWEALRGYGLKVFISDEDLQNTVGFSFLDKIDFALGNSQHLLLLASQNSLDSVYVRDEYQAFYNDCHVKNPEKRLLIVYQLDHNLEIRSLPRILRNKQIASKPEQIVATLVREDLMDQDPPVPAPSDPVLKEVSDEEITSQEGGPSDGLSISKNIEIKRSGKQISKDKPLTSQDRQAKEEKKEINRTSIFLYYACVGFYLVFTIALSNTSSESEGFISLFFAVNAALSIFGAILAKWKYSRLIIAALLPAIGQVIILGVMIFQKIGDLEIVIPLNLFIMAVFLGFALHFRKRFKRENEH